MFGVRLCNDMSFFVQYQQLRSFSSAFRPDVEEFLDISFNRIYTMNHKTGKVYMVVFNKPVNGVLRVKLHKGTRLVGARLLDGKKELAVEEISRQEYFVHVNGKAKGKDPFVIEIDLRQGEGEAEKQYVAPKI